MSMRVCQQHILKINLTIIFAHTDYDTEYMGIPIPHLDAVSGNHSDYCYRKTHFLIAPLWRSPSLNTMMTRRLLPWRPAPTAMGPAELFQLTQLGFHIIPSACSHLRRCHLSLVGGNFAESKLSTASVKVAHNRRESRMRHTP